MSNPRCARRPAVVDVVGGQVDLGLAEAGAVGRSIAMALMAPVFGLTMSIAAASPAFCVGSRRNDGVDRGLCGLLDRGSSVVVTTRPPRRSRFARSVTVAPNS